MSEEGYEHVPHRYMAIKGFARPVCVDCGHLFFKNYLSIWVDAKGCDYKWHPGYKKACVSEVRCWRKDKGIE